MRFKEYIEIQSKECPNREIRRVWQDMLYNFNIYTEKEETAKIYKKISSNIKADNIDYKRIWILHFYSPLEYKEKNLTDKDNIECGYKSAISDDIISDSGDDYVYVGKTDVHKFYVRDDVYYVRTIGETTLNRVTESNYCLYQDYLDLLNNE